MTDDRYGEGYHASRRWADQQEQNRMLDDDARERWRSEFCKTGGKIAARRSRVV